jgi:hypothetical protein
VEQFRYLGTTITNENLIQEEIRRRLNSGNACYHSVQNLLSSRLLSKKHKNLNSCRILVGKPEGKRPMRTPRRRWEDNIKMDIRYIHWDCMDWIYVALNRDQWRALVNTAINLRVPLNGGMFLSDCTIGGFSRRSQLRA